MIRVTFRRNWSIRLSVLLAALTVLLISQGSTALADDGVTTAEITEAKNPAALFLPLVRQPESSASLSRYDIVSVELLLLVNDERIRNGCPALTVDERLGAAAQSHTLDMQTNSFLDHQGSDGLWPHERILRAGYTFSYVGETCAMSTVDSAEYVFNLWMNSPGHRKVLLNCASRDIGIGYALPYWTLDFASPQ